MSEQPQEDHRGSDWIEREVKHSRHVIANAKIVVTFSAAVAATFVATSMQAKGQGCWNDVASGFMLATLILTGWVVLKRTKSHQGRLVQADFDNAVKLVDEVHCLVKWQLAFSLISSCVAAVGLLRSEGLSG